MLFSNDCRRKDFQNLRIYRRRYRRYYEIPNVREEPCKNDRANMFLYKLYRKNFVRKSKPPHRGLRRTFWASRSNNKFNSYIKKKNKPLYKFRVHYKMDNYIHSIIKYRFNRRLLVKKKNFLDIQILYLKYIMRHVQNILFVMKIYILDVLDDQYIGRGMMVAGKFLIIVI